MIVFDAGRQAWADEVAAKLLEPVVIGNATLYCGDCRDILPMLDRVDAVITDPPYGIGFAHGAGGDGIGGGKYVSAFNGVPVIGDDKPFDPSHLLALNCPTILWGANHYADRLPSSPRWLIWDKRVGLTTNDFADCEIAWCNVKGVARVFRHYWNGMMRDSERGTPRQHPTQKPIAVMRWCIEQLGNPRSIGDFYMGSGTTGVAAAQMGLAFVGVEIDPSHFDIACRRIEEAQKQAALFPHEPPKPQEQLGLVA